MNITLEEILMVIISFLIGWFLRTMIGSDKSQQKIKVNTNKHNKNTKVNTNKHNKNTKVNTSVGVGHNNDVVCDPPDEGWRGDKYCRDNTLYMDGKCKHVCLNWDSIWPWSSCTEGGYRCK